MSDYYYGDAYPAQMPYQGGLEDATDEEIAFIDREIANYEDTRDRELSRADVYNIAEVALRNRHEDGSPNIAGALFAHDMLATEQEDRGWDESFERGKSQLEEKLGRRLLDSEIEQLKDRVPQEAVLFDDNEGLDVAGAWESGPGRDGDEFDMNTSNGRIQFMTQRIFDRRQRENPTPATVEPLAPDASNDEAAKWAAARMAGAEVATPEPAPPEAV